MFAQGSRSRLTVAAESSFGVLPTTPDFLEVPLRSHSINLAKERVQSEELRSDRMQNIDRHGNRSAAGTIECDLRREAYDLLLESAFFDSFDTADHITIGTTPKFLTFEDAALDVDQYRQFSGCLVNSASFNIAPNQMVQTTFDIVGRDMVQDDSSISGTPTPPPVYEPFDSYNGALLEGGVGTADGLCIVSALQFSINNNVAPVYSILCDANRDTAAQMEFGMAVVEGTMTVYYEDDALIKKFLNEEESEISVTVDDPTGANGYTFYFPRVKYNGADVPLANMQSRLIELPFVALRGGISNPFSLRLTRTSGT